MMPSLQGGIVGLLLGLFAWAVCQFVANHIERTQPGEKGRRTAGILRLAGLLTLVIDTVVGYLFLGPALEGLL